MIQPNSGTETPPCGSGALPTFDRPLPNGPDEELTPNDVVEALIAADVHARRVREGAEYELFKREVRRHADALEHESDIDALNARSRSLTEFLAEKPAGSPRYDIAELLPVEGNFTLLAAKKTGKTTTTVELVRAVADGEPFLGRFQITDGPGNVAVWDYEMSEDQLREWIRDAGVRNTGNVYVLSLRGIYASLRTPATREWAVKWLRDRQIRVWVLDPAHRAMTGFTTQSDPNDAVLEFTETLEQIKREAGVRNIGLPIHTGIRGDHARGASRWGDWPDAIWTLKKDESGRRTLQAEGRDVNLQPADLQMDPNTRRLSVPVFATATSVYQGTSDVDKLCMWLASNPGKHPSKRGVALALGVSQGKAATVMELAEDAERIVVQPGPRRSHRAWLPEHWKAEEKARQEDAQGRQMEL
ncbi:AAA family ATPase [Streptomyces microflavus]|uniref:AAA family ATPase n=1 Tax=Streptomyces microflavus TaxID=1919 RepID=UPI00332B0185